ncbi:MAG: 4-hydroxy-3-methylbut-2-enyl diphosphate reductase [Candidatus Omnitrophica bacterium]|nr:4-hydroxy-3-methylbut-2-enyl diphosphate reductase [Candidatus Omnitrophota bacterium]MCM8809236.1 4-hydroxy-3-methylbut-2-enyl diphosphate reductase [Candidatus Omnitrophota bacterium]MCM8810506.1 4-hydroxy-3-methylbut-2-enyl diphosphate reductase [Candidatus Omnitrophota bacterium]
MKKIIVAKNIGFCFGVKRAVETTEELLYKLKSLSTVGDVVHNPLVMEKLKLKGLKVYNSIEEVKGKFFLIRSHGLPKNQIEKLKKLNFKIYDMTCPFVKKIHYLVEDLSNKCYTILIVGNKNHPEVLGIKGYGRNIKIIENKQDILKHKHKKLDRVAVISQTTLNFDYYYDIVKNIIEMVKAKEMLVLNTICKVTEEREKESIEITKKVDTVLVLGGKESSNTKKLFKICKKECKYCFLVENFSDLSKINFNNFNEVGIISGTSTPNFFIKEVIEYLKKIGYKEVS